MSNRMLEERREREYARRVAAALDLSLADLERLEWSIDTNESEDGALYGYIVSFQEGSDPEVLAKVQGLDGKGWIQIGPVL